MNELGGVGEEALFDRVNEILEVARSRVARTVNTEMVNAYWRVGREIVLVEQSGATRGTYGDGLIERLAAKLKSRGMGRSNLRLMRQFYLAFNGGSMLSPNKPLNSQGKQIHQTVSGEFPPMLSWSHYVTLLRVVDPQARAFYEIEAAGECWSVRQLERQIEAKLFERLSSKGAAAALAEKGQSITTAKDLIKDPFVLEFLGLPEDPASNERGLEQRIIDKLEHFLLELGKGFCFVGRQRRITLEGDHFYVDLVFYNRLLRAFVLVDLKLGKLNHQDLGQMQMYVNFFDRFQRLDGEAKTIGIVLCSDKNEAMVRVTLPESNEQVLTARYQEVIPSEAELVAQLTRDREEAEHALNSLERTR